MVKIAKKRMEQERGYTKSVWPGGCGSKEGVVPRTMWQQEGYSNEGVAARRVRGVRVL